MDLYGNLQNYDKDADLNVVKLLTKKKPETRRAKVGRLDPWTQS